MAPPAPGRIFLYAAPLLGLLTIVLAFDRVLVRPTVLGLVVVVWGFFLFLAYFFRDPERSPGNGIVSPADGKVLAVGPDGERTRIAVFMNVTDVHVNRLPLDGRVVRIDDGGEGFRPAFHPDAIHNVWRRYTLDTAIGEVEVVQMTGIVARRILSFLKPGESGHKGDRLGMIVLGSRVDLLFPTDRAKPTVRVGERVWAGTTTVAEERTR
ncbi:MAG: phosphatidylserine decarboxylase [Thermoplasmata archaeon]|nr:phosphatidylserine decarboxylase [Thermoplasmata archaeon]